MEEIEQRLTVVKVRKPRNSDLNCELQWFCRSLGMFGLRDKDKSCYRIFIELLKQTKKDHAITSDELAFKLNLTRGTIIHHLNKLMESGIVINHKSKYVLRVANLDKMIDELEKDVQRTWNDIKDVAKKIDQEMGL